MKVSARSRAWLGRHSGGQRAHHSSESKLLLLRYSLRGLQLVPHGLFNSGDLGHATAVANGDCIGRPCCGEAHAGPHLHHSCGAAVAETAEVGAGSGQFWLKGLCQQPVAPKFL